MSEQNDTAETELERIKRELNEARVPREVHIGTDSTADRVAWLVKRNALNERAANGRFEKFAVEFGLLTSADGEWRTAKELHARIGYGEIEDVKRALEYLWERGLLDGCNERGRGNLYAAKGSKL